MTKEDLLLEIERNSGMGNVSVRTVYKTLNKFFESNVCIHKGENRHPYADVLHSFAEGTPIQYRTRTDYEWEDVQSPKWEYQIKPKEPIYEWQWVKDKYGLEIARSSFFTKEEAKEHLNSYWVKLEETKRERT